MRGLKWIVALILVSFAIPASAAEVNVQVQRRGFFARAFGARDRVNVQVNGGGHAVAVQKVQVQKVQRVQVVQQHVQRVQVVQAVPVHVQSFAVQHYVPVQSVQVQAVHCNCAAFFSH